MDGYQINRLSILLAPLGLLVAGLLWWPRRSLDCSTILFGCVYWPFLAIGVTFTAAYFATRGRTPGDRNEPEPAKRTPKPKATKVPKRDVALTPDADGNLVRAGTGTVDQTDEYNLDDWDLD